jgi:hypothetical protein
MNKPVLKIPATRLNNREVKEDAGSVLRFYLRG